MLLCPRNPCEKICKKLRFNVDDTEPTKYFICDTCGASWGDLLSGFTGVTCSCGRLMECDIKLGEDHFQEDVFVKQDIQYLIFDDLRI